MSNEIDLSELSGKNNTHKLLDYFKKTADLKQKFRLITPEIIPAAEQRGENCKLKALADAMAYTALKCKTNSLPLYKAKKYSSSLRELAKKNGSVVGEVYSIEMLRKTCSDAGFESEMHTPETPDDYIKTLEKLVDANQAPMVFFDMDRSDERYGLPYMGDGSNEHATVVVGYYKIKDQTHFIVNQWGVYYDFNGMELALSSFTSLKDKRTVETFNKYYDTSNDNTKWLTTNTSPWVYIKLGDVPARTAKAMKDTDTPLKGKIVVVTRPHAHDNPLVKMGVFDSSAESKTEQKADGKVEKKAIKIVTEHVTLEQFKAS
jgi:hypothetical protein